MGEHATFKHGFSAMAREDVADARRRRAERSIAPWAAARGLEVHGTARLAGFAPAQPRFLEEQQELLRGVLPGGRFGILFHRLLQTHAGGDSAAMPGSYYGVFVKPPRGALRRALTPNRSWIPVIGAFLDDGVDDHETAFGMHGAWAPTTVCAVHVPETVAAGFSCVLRSRSRTPWARGVVEDVGSLKALARAGAFLQDARVRSLLASLDGPYWEVRLDHGVLVVQRNGFVVEDAELDALCAFACALGDALVACAVPAATLDRDPGLAGGWSEDAARTAAARGLVLEDGADLHRARPSLPLPGRAHVAFRHGDTRVVLCTDQPVRVLKAMRPVLVAPAPGVAETGPGGVGVPGARVFVRDGMAVVWALEHRGYVGEALDLAATLRPHLQAATSNQTGATLVST